MSSEPEPCEEPELSVEGEEIVCETYVVKSEEDDDPDDEDAQSETFSVEGHRPVRPVERQKMRPWLIDLLDKNILPGLSWQNKKENIFRISWKHAAHNCFNRNRDSDLFERWAVHTGRHHEGNHKRWKANFRCALNSLPDVMELKELGVRKGDNAFKVYKFLDSADPTLKEKMEIKRKYSLMAGIKLEESQSGSSTPTASTAPSSPDPESSVGVDGGIQTLLKAIELKTQQQDHSKTPQKRASTGGIIQTRSKRSKKESKDDSENQHPEATVMYQLPLTISSGRPSPASTPGSDRSTSSTATPDEAKQLRLPYFGSVDPKTGKLTLVQLKKSDLPSAPSTPTGTASSLSAARPDMIVNVQSQGHTVTTLSQPGIATPQVQTGVKPGDQIVTLPLSLAEKLKTGSAQEQKVTIPIHLLQQEFLQKSAQSQGLVSLGALLAGNPVASMQVTKQLESFLNPAVPIPLPVLEQINQAKLKEKQKSLSESQLPLTKSDTQTEVEMPGLITSPLITDNATLPIPQLNKNITSIAAALRMSAPVTKPSTGPVATATTSTIQTTLANPGVPSGGLVSDPHGIRSKLVSRLMVSGSSMTSTAPNVRMPTGIQMAAPMSTPRPRLDHLLVKPNPNLTLPRTQLQPVKQSDLVVTAMATSSNIDYMSTTGPPKLMPVSDATIDLSAKVNTEPLNIPATATKTTDTDVVGVASSGSAVSSPVCTPELRSDILDKQVTIELGKMEKEILTAKSPEETQHFSDNSSCSKRTVQTQCNMFLWNYFNGKLDESAKCDPYMTHLPPARRTVWTQCTFVENVTVRKSTKEKTGISILKSGEITGTNSPIKQALTVLKLLEYRVLNYKVMRYGKKNKKSLVITNRRYFGALGHNFDPLTLTLTSDAKVTLNIAFKPIEEFSLSKKDNSFCLDYFTEILDKITHYSFCKGIHRKLGRRNDAIFFKYPFRRCQSEECLLWFNEGQLASRRKTLVTQCSFCKSLDQPVKRNPVSTEIVPPNRCIVKEILPSDIVINQLVPAETIVLQEMEKVVVEKVELPDTMLSCIRPIPP